MNKNEQSRDLTQRYLPIALYYEEADSLEYVRSDEPCVHRRVDEILTLIVRMTDRNLIGFQLKGFRHFYLQHLRNQRLEPGSPFPKLVEVLEHAISTIGNKIFEEQGRFSAYNQAREIAEIDRVRVSDLPKVA